MAKQSGGAERRSGSGESGGPNVLVLLAADHRRVELLTEEFEDAEDEADQIELSQQICDELTVHARLEEEIFYPAVREALGEDAAGLLDEALVEHLSARDLIDKVEGSEPSEPLFRAQVNVLAEYVKHHVWEEENELFERVRRSPLDLAALGTEVSQRRLELLAELGLDGEVVDAAAADDDDENFEEEDEDVEEEDAEERGRRGKSRGTRPPAR